MTDWQPVEIFFGADTKNWRKRRFLSNSLLLDIFVREIFSGIGPYESSRPEDYEKVVVFGRRSFLTGIIVAQSQILGASSKIRLCRKKDTATILISEVRHE